MKIKTLYLMTFFLIIVTFTSNGLFATYNRLSVPKIEGQILNFKEFKRIEMNYFAHSLCMKENNSEDTLSPLREIFPTNLVEIDENGNFVLQATQGTITTPNLSNKCQIFLGLNIAFEKNSGQRGQRLYYLIDSILASPRYKEQLETVTNMSSLDLTIE